MPVSDGRLPDEPGDRILTDRIKDGCAGSFELLVERHTARLLRFLSQRTGNRHDAEDLVQETWVRAYRFMTRYDPSYAFPVWLYSIGVNLTASHARKRRETTVLDSKAESKNEIETAVSENASTLMQASEARKDLWSVADRVLPHKQREALWLFYVDGFSVNDIAAVMGITRTSVKVLLCRARTKMASELRKAQPEICPEDSGPSVADFRYK